MKKFLLALGFLLLVTPASAQMRRNMAALLLTSGGGTGGGLCSGVIFNTSFTEGADVTPFHSTPELGTFTTDGEGDSGLFIVDSSTDMLKVTATDSGTIFMSGSPCSSNYKVTFVAKNGSSTGNDRVGVALRYNIGASQGYVAWVTGSGFVTIVRDDDDVTSTTLYTGGGTPVVPANYYVYEFWVVDDDISVYFNGNLIRTVTDATYTDAGQVGLYMRNQNARIDSAQITVNP